MRTWSVLFFIMVVVSTAAHGLLLLDKYLQDQALFFRSCTSCCKVSFCLFKEFNSSVKL